MLSSVKDVLTKEVNVKGILTKEVHVREFLEMEIELTKLKELLATEIKLKEFLVQEIDLGRLLSKKAKVNDAHHAHDEEKAILHVDDKVSKDQSKTKVAVPRKRDLPAYDYSLVDNIHMEHKKIRFIFNQIMSSTLEKNYVKVATLLEVFNKEIRAHYKKSDVELYAYLKIYIQMKYPKREKAFTQLSLEMKNLSIEIFYIISQSPNVPLTEHTYSGFMKEFMNVGKLLNERVLREQSVLFKMYQQTKTAKSIS